MNTDQTLWRVSQSTKICDGIRPSTWLEWRNGFELKFNNGIFIFQKDEQEEISHPQEVYELGLDRQWVNFPSFIGLRYWDILYEEYFFQRVMTNSNSRQNIVRSLVGIPRY